MRGYKVLIEADFLASVYDIIDTSELYDHSKSIREFAKTIKDKLDKNFPTNTRITIKELNESHKNI